DAVPVRQVQVEDDGPRPVQLFVPLAQRPGGCNDEPLFAHNLLQRDTSSSVVLDDQDLERQCPRFSERGISAIRHATRMPPLRMRAFWRLLDESLADPCHAFPPAAEAGNIRGRRTSQLL